MRASLVLLCVSVLSACGATNGLPKPIFYLPLDGSTTAAIAGGRNSPQFVSQPDDILTLVDLQQNKFAPGRVGQCYDAVDSPLEYRCSGNFHADEGTCAFWMNPDFRGDNTNLYCTFFGAADWGMLYKYLNQTTLTFGTAKEKGDLYYDCGSGSIAAWKPGEWHHIAITWSRRENLRRIYIDGAPVAHAPFPFNRNVGDGPLFIGSGCTLYPGHTAHAKLDEVAIWDRPLDDADVRTLYQLGLQGKPIAEEKAPAATGTLENKELNVVQPSAPTPPNNEIPHPVRLTPARETVSLNGWWHFLPATDLLTRLPDAGWGLSRVPGYWTSREDTLAADGKSANGRWHGQALTGFGIGYYQRSFIAEPGWKSSNVFLQFGGADGLADIYLNGKHLGTLPSWTAESYDIGARLRFGASNTLTILLCSRGGSSGSGIYDDVSLCIVGRAMTDHIVVTPSVAKQQITFAVDLWHRGAPADARIEFDVSPASAPDKVEQRFVRAVQLGSIASAAQSALTSRVEFTFDWIGAHWWTYDDPFLYVVRTKLYLGDALIDESPPTRFGFREFTMRGSEFFLNGKPTHLRGHQIDLAWSDQMAHVEELKAAGMNCFELSGPVSHSWYGGTPYRKHEFEEILDYADEHGLIAIPILPGATVLKDRIFDPEVARLYRQRVVSHVERFGNHPSICLWYMHFNLAGYRWYHPPTNIDGSYKPDDAGFRDKEHYCLQAQHIVQSFDPRPIYHHACGDFGDIYTLNCYIGPTCPLQEREEWPLRWAEKRPFPLVACEHGLMLIPYWFRARQFPLSVVYASEPVFDEISAMYLGPRAYDLITPNLFDLYDIGRKSRSDRTRKLIQHHPGYQETKSLFARYSLRAWRTFGVTGIIFNAINWDFKDDAGKPLPVMRALARYFGDTDLYIAGPQGDWLSKDHSYRDGETIRKQVVLLNDLTRDLPCPLEWRLTDATGNTVQQGRMDAVARAGEPMMYPITCRDPAVQMRTSFHLVVTPVNAATAHFQPDSFALQVFPQPSRLRVNGQVFVYDPVGETTAMLRRAGVGSTPLTDGSDLSHAALIIVGRQAYTSNFLRLAHRLQLENAVRNGANLLIFEQTIGSPCGLKLSEQSTRDVFIAQPGHPFLKGLDAADFINFRGQSDLIDAYPPAPAWTKDKWPARYFKWGNRGVVATFVLRKPHYAPFVPVLECGFDLVDSPLLEARFDAGRVVLCQVDVTSRYSTDPVSTRLVDNLLDNLTTRAADVSMPNVAVGESAVDFLRRFGISATPFDGRAKGLVTVGGEALTSAQTAALQSAASDGATVLFLPNSPAARACGLEVKDQRLFIGKPGPSPLLAGLSAADLYLKQWLTLPVIQPINGWRILTAPGLVAEKQLGRGRLLACELDLDAMGASRARIKSLRFWNVLLANLGVQRRGFDNFLQPAAKVYEDNEWEEIPPFMSW